MPEHSFSRPTKCDRRGGGPFTFWSFASGSIPSKLINILIRKEKQKKGKRREGKRRKGKGRRKEKRRERRGKELRKGSSSYHI